MRYIMVFPVLLCLAAIAFPSTICVPDDYTMIQDAIDAATDGDTIVVRRGTYFENIEIRDKYIVVKSARGPEVTIIDGMQSMSVVKFDGQQASAPILEGFTLTNGSASKGGGIYCHKSSCPEIINNIIACNHADSGAGIYCKDSSPTISHNVISGNVANKDGGGIYCYKKYANPTIINNTVYGNTAGDEGGGIECHDASPEIVNTIVWHNLAPVGPEIHISRCGAPNVTFCDVRGGYSGTGNIDADPLFVAAADGDFHILYTSPCRNAGDDTAPSLPAEDFEGDPRIGCGFVDIGADEFYCHLYATGPVSPSKKFEIMAVGKPRSLATLGLGSGLQDPPLGGVLWLLPPITRISMGMIPASGVLVYNVTGHPNWKPGDSYPFQAIISLPAHGRILTNLMVLDVE